MYVSIPLPVCMLAGLIGVSRFLLRFLLRGFPWCYALLLW